MVKVCQSAIINSMNPIIATNHVANWLDALNVEDDIHLFDMDGDPDCSLTVRLDAEGLMQRSQAFSDHIEAIKKRVKSAFGTPNCPEGVIYLIYRTQKDSTCPEPLYIGVSDVKGDKGEINSLFKSGHIRFGHKPKVNGHLSKLNEALQAALGGRLHSHRHWIDEMFEDVTTPRLKTPVYVHMQVWEVNSQSIFPEMEHCSILTEEQIRLELVRQSGRGDHLLNK